MLREQTGQGERRKKGLAVLKGWVLMGALPPVPLPSLALPPSGRACTSSSHRPPRKTCTAMWPSMHWTQPPATPP